MPVSDQPPSEESAGRSKRSAPPPPSQEFLRRVAEEVRAAFPRSVDTAELVLIDIDPHRLHAFWNLPLGDFEAARNGGGVAGGQAPMVLRLHPVTRQGHDLGDEPAIDVEVAGLRSSVYADIWGETRDYRAELGLGRADGTLVVLARSNLVALPPPSATNGGAFQTLRIEPPLATPSTLVPFPFPPEFGGETAEPLPPEAHETPFAEPPAGGDVGTAADFETDEAPWADLPIALESVLPVSSFIFAGEEVALEVVAELHIHGHTRPGRELHLFGQQVRVRPDGSFSIRKILPNDPMLIEALLASADSSEPPGDR